MSHSLDKQVGSIEIFPTRLSDIAEEWWDALFNGALWVVDLHGFPVPTRPGSFRTTCYNKAHARSLRVRCNLDKDCRRMFVQAHNMIPFRPWPRSAAKPAPEVPTLVIPPLEEQVRPVERAPQVDSKPTISLILPLPDEPAPGTLPALPARQPPGIRKAKKMCSCGTADFRFHAETCALLQDAFARDEAEIAYHASRSATLPPLVPREVSQEQADADMAELLARCTCGSTDPKGHPASCRVWG